MFNFQRNDYDSDEKAVERIAKTILKYALRDGAKAIRFDLDGTEESEMEAWQMGIKSWRIHLLIGDDWQLHMNLPKYVQEPVLAYYREMFGADNCLRLRFEEKSQHILMCYQATANWQSDEQAEDLIIRMEWDVESEISDYAKWA